VDTHEAGYTILAKDPARWEPKTKETADHSLPYIVGMALLEGRINNATYNQKKLKDPETLRFLKKISVREDKGLTAMYPDSIANRVTIKLTSGQVFSAQVNDPKGHPKNPMSKEDIEAKFASLTRKYLAEDRRRRVLDQIWSFERINPSELMAGLVLPK
jgi:2-methylcitrate dehydratase